MRTRKDGIVAGENFMSKIRTQNMWSLRRQNIKSINYTGNRVARLRSDVIDYNVKVFIKEEKLKVEMTKS